MVKQNKTEKQANRNKPFWMLSVKWDKYIHLMLEAWAVPVSFTFHTEVLKNNRPHCDRNEKGDSVYAWLLGSSKKMPKLWTTTKNPRCDSDAMTSSVCFYLCPHFICMPVFSTNDSEPV